MSWDLRVKTHLKGLACNSHNKSMTTKLRWTCHRAWQSFYLFWAICFSKIPSADFINIYHFPQAAHLTSTSISTACLKCYRRMSRTQKYQACRISKGFIDLVVHASVTTSQTQLIKMNCWKTYDQSRPELTTSIRVCLPLSTSSNKCLWCSEGLCVSFRTHVPLRNVQ